MTERVTNLAPIHESNISNIMHFSNMCITNDIDELRNIHRDIRNDQRSFEEQRDKKPKIKTLPLVIKTDYPRGNIGEGSIVMPLIPPAPRGRDMPIRSLRSLRSLRSIRPKIFSFEG
jgi:hypothetical protein